MRRLLHIFCIALLLISSVGCASKRPIISEEALIGSAQIIQGYGEIEEAEVIIDDGKIKFYLVPRDEEVSKERLRELGIDFMKVLSGYTADENLKGPTDESYGEIYNYYDVEMIVEGNRGAVLDLGKKNKRKVEIQWK